MRNWFSGEWIWRLRSRLRIFGDAEIAREVQVAIEHVLANYSGEWWVSVVGSQANDRWGNTRWTGTLNKQAQS
jgi:hypothetical protein